MPTHSRQSRVASAGSMRATIEMSWTGFSTSDWTVTSVTIQIRSALFSMTRIQKKVMASLIVLLVQLQKE